MKESVFRLRSEFESRSEKRMDRNLNPDRHLFLDCSPNSFFKHLSVFFMNPRAMINIFREVSPLYPCAVPFFNLFSDVFSS